MNRLKALLIAAITTACAVFCVGSAARANPYLAQLRGDYQFERRAVNREQNLREDQLRAWFDARNDALRHQWQAERRGAPAQARKVLDQNYHADRRALRDVYDARLKQLRGEYSTVRDIIRDEYQHDRRHGPAVYHSPLHTTQRPVIVQPSPGIQIQLGGLRFVIPTR